MRLAGGAAGLAKDFVSLGLEFRDIDGGGWLVNPSAGRDLDADKERLLLRLLELTRSAPAGRVNLGSELGNLYQEDVAFRSVVSLAGGAKGLTKDFVSRGLEFDGGGWLILHSEGCDEGLADDFASRGLELRGEGGAEAAEAAERRGRWLGRAARRACLLLDGVLPIKQLLDNLLLLSAPEAEDPLADPDLMPKPPRADPNATRRTVYSDGAWVVYQGKDPRMARAAWGLHAAAAEGHPALELAGPVRGSQLSGRAELTAAVAAGRIGAAPVELVTDSQSLASGVARLAEGASPERWADSDLWALLQPAARSGHLRARWTTSHKSAAEYGELGLPEGDRMGNERADALANAAATARAELAVAGPRLL